MANRKMTHPETFEGIYRRLEEVMLANSGENEFEEIFKLVIIKLWKELKEPDRIIDDILSANRALAKIDKVWKSVLTETELKITDEQYQVCNNIISAFDFSGEGYEGIDAIFEFLISKEKKGAKGQFFTPRYIIDFCVKVIAPKNGENILDPACGSGAFLYHAYLNGSSDGRSLWGFDFDAAAVRISRLLMYVGEVPEAHIYKVNSLIGNSSRAVISGNGLAETAATIEDILRIEKFKGLFDIIITNPPFAGEIVEPEILANYEVAVGKTRIERDILFIERCIHLLKDNGRMAIILPDNIFGGKETKELRKWIYERCRIVGVVGIPRNAFMPHTPIKTSILFLQKREKRRKSGENIFFAISENPGKDSRGRLIFKHGNSNSWKNVDHDLEEIVPKFREFIKNENFGW